MGGNRSSHLIFATASDHRDSLSCIADGWDKAESTLMTMTLGKHLSFNVGSSSVGRK